MDADVPPKEKPKNKCFNFCGVRWRICRRRAAQADSIVFGTLLTKSRATALVSNVLDVGVMYPVHFPYFDRRRQRVERILRPSLESEPIRETAEVAFLDSAERHNGCTLDDFVFQGESCLQVANFVRYCLTEGMQLLGCAILILSRWRRLND
jgi:hypothetical protein